MYNTNISADNVVDNMKNRIKIFKDKHSIDRELISQIPDTQLINNLIKSHISERLAKHIYEEMNSYFHVEEHSFIGITTVAELIVMPYNDWVRIKQFLDQNNFQFEDLNNESTKV